MRAFPILVSTERKARRVGWTADLAFYNRCRPHSSLGGQPPDQVSFNQPHAKPGGGLTSAEIHLSTDHKLFKIDEPPLSIHQRHSNKRSLPIMVSQRL